MIHIEQAFIEAPTYVYILYTLLCSYAYPPLIVVVPCCVVSRVHYLCVMCQTITTILIITYNT